MNSKCFQEIAVTSANNCLELAKTAPAVGISVIKISIIKELDDLPIYKIKLSEKPKQIDSLRVAIDISGLPSDFYEEINKNIIYSNHAHISNFDYETKETYLEVSDELLTELKRLDAKSSHITLISDLRFLIKNIYEWYDNYGAWVHVPHNEVFPEDEIYHQHRETKDQYDAVKNVLTNSISYIWGAPGTGKTQVVLADVAMTYIKQKKKILLVAPTNNALEQSLRSVINALNENGQDYSCLYRMGVSSDLFAREYGKICETVDLKTKSEELAKLIMQTEKKLENARKHKIAEIELKKITADIEENAKVRANLMENIARLEDEIKDCNASILSLSALIESLRDERSNFAKQINGFFFRFRSRKRKDELIRARNKTDEEIKKYCESQEATIKEKSGKQSLLNEKKLKVKELSEKITRESSEIDLFSFETYGKIYTTNELCELLSGEIGNYSEEDETDILTKLNKYKSDLAFLKERINEERKSKLIYAFTADYFFGHYKDMLDSGVLKNIYHILLDEAAYLPMIKAGILFSLGAPVAFFGDDMQLPPVSDVPEETLTIKDNKLFLWDKSALYFPDIFKEGITYDDLFESYSEENPPLFEHTSVSFLPKTFRFGNNLAKILDDFVYQKGLCGADEFDTKITVLDVPHSNTGNESEEEADAVSKYVNSNHLDNYAVLTPYNLQVKKLREKHLPEDNIFTVHKSQGQEWDTVILSVVKNFPTSFLDAKLINTAVSRAKKNLVIVCNRQSWIQKKDNFITRLVSEATETVSI